MSLSDVKKEIKGWLSPSTRKFGAPGPATKEMSCPQVHAYLRCQGYLGNEQKKIALLSHDTVEEARIQFGRAMRQQKILDEEGYELDPQSLLWQHTKNCHVNLVFAYSREAEFQLARQNATKVVENTCQRIHGAVDASVDGLRNSNIPKKICSHSTKDDPEPSVDSNNNNNNNNTFHRQDKQESCK